MPNPKQTPKLVSGKWSVKASRLEWNVLIYFLEGYYQYFYRYNLRIAPLTPTLFSVSEWFALGLRLPAYQYIVKRILATDSKEPQISLPVIQWYALREAILHTGMNITAHHEAKELFEQRDHSMILYALMGKIDQSLPQTFRPE